MKKSITFLIAFVAVFIIALNYSPLTDFVNNLLQNQIASFGYFGIFILVFLLELIPQPFISAILPVTGGILINLNFYYVLAAGISAAISSNYLAYFLGIKYGDKLAVKLLKEKNYAYAQRWFNKHGNKSVAILAITPLPYFPIMGGVFKMSLKEFTIYGILPRIAHFIIFGSLSALLI